MALETALTGLLTATDWNDDGSVRRISLLTSDEFEYELLPDSACRDLLPFLRGRALVRGYLRSGGPRPRFEVKSFQILHDEA